MKLTNLALIVAFATGMAAPAYAAMDQTQMDAMKADMDKAGTADKSRMAFWKGMAPDRQAFWKEQCNTGGAPRCRRTKSRAVATFPLSARRS